MFVRLIAFAIVTLSLSGCLATGGRIGITPGGQGYGFLEFGYPQQSPSTNRHHPYSQGNGYYPPPRRMVRQCQNVTEYDGSTYKRCGPWYYE